MNVKVNLGVLYDYGLSPDDYVALYLIHTNCEKDFKFGMTKAMKRLHDKGIINGKGVIIAELPEDFFGDNPKIDSLETYWLEFKALYPKTDGPRRLHDSPSKCKDKYLKLIRKNIELHLDITKGIKAEMGIRESADKRSEFFQAPKLMSSYINQKAWEGYLDVEDEDAHQSNMDIL